MPDQERLTMPPASTDPIKHIIVLMPENRSFDQMMALQVED
jgi:phospholipase C